MSLTKTSDDEEGEEDDDDDFKDVISLMEGKVPGEQNGRKAKMEGMYTWNFRLRLLQIILFADEGASGAERSIISEGAAEPGKAGKKKKKEKKEKKRKTKEKKEKAKKGWSLLVRILNQILDALIYCINNNTVSNKAVMCGPVYSCDTDGLPNYDFHRV